MVSKIEHHLSQADKLLSDIGMIQRDLDYLLNSGSEDFVQVSGTTDVSDSFEQREEEELTATIAHNLKLEREKRGLTQKDLSDLTGIQRPNIARLEKGVTLPNLGTILKLSNGLRCPIEKILTLHY